MNERDRNREEQLDRLFARTRTQSLPVLEPDPYLPARIRAMSRSHSEGAPAGGRMRWRWLRTSLAAAAVVLVAGLGAYVGYRAGTESQMFSLEEASEADAFMAALSQSGFVDDLSRLDSANREVNE